MIVAWFERGAAEKPIKEVQGMPAGMADGTYRRWGLVTNRPGHCHQASLICKSTQAKTCRAAAPVLLHPKQSKCACAKLKASKNSFLRSIVCTWTICGICATLSRRLELAGIKSAAERWRQSLTGLKRLL